MEAMIGYMLCTSNYRLCVEKLKEMGVPSGPLYGRLKKGEEIVTPSGITVSEIH